MTDDRDFLKSFDAADIAQIDWTHVARVRAAYLLLSECSFPEAVRRIRCGIRRLNRAHGVENTDAGGYHETLTLALARLVAAAMGPAAVASPFDAFIESHSELLDPEEVLHHYSSERLGSARARSEFLLPDRRPLPPAIARRRVPMVVPAAMGGQGPAPELRMLG